MKRKEDGGRRWIAEEGPGDKRERRRAGDRTVDTRIRPEHCMTSYEDSGVVGCVCGNCRGMAGGALSSPVTGFSVVVEFAVDVYAKTIR